MKLGLSLFGIGLRSYGEVARQAEEAGFESVWLPEHLIFPAEIPPSYPYSESGLPPVVASTPLFDPWVTLAYVAACTTRIRLGTHVYVLPLRHPIVTARAFTTLDRISGGRAILGIGVGWLREEFEIVGETFHDRGKRTDEILDILVELWTQETPEYHGKYYDIPRVKFEPKPRRKPHPPIEIGGASRSALRRAALRGDGWLAIGADVDRLPRAVAELARLRREAGREGPFEITVSNQLRNDPESVRRYAEAGATRLLLRPEIPGSGRLAPEDVAAFLERASRDLIPLRGPGE